MRPLVIVYSYIGVVLVATLLACVLPEPYWRWAYRVTFLGCLGPLVLRWLESLGAQ